MSLRRVIHRIHRGCKVFDIDEVWLALALARFLDEPEGFKLMEELGRLLVGAVEDPHSFFQGINDIDPAFIIHPAILKGKPDALQHDAVEELGIRGHIPEVFSEDQFLRKLEIVKVLACLAVEVVIHAYLNSMISSSEA